MENARARSAAELARTLQPGDLQRLADWLSEESTPLERWSAAARCVVALEAYELAPLVARALDPGAAPGRAASARTTLHALYGRWFGAPADVAPYLEAVGPGAGTRLLVEAMLAEEARSRGRLLGELELRPSAAGAWLTDPDPEIRSEAARVLARSLARDGSDAGTLLALVAHLEGEEDPRAFHEALQACVVLLERVEVDHPGSLRLRALLVDLARGGDGARALSLAQVMARIPWRTRGARDLGNVLTAIDALGSMARSLAAADRLRGVNDPDPLVAVLGASRQLCVTARADGLGGELRAGPARDGLIELLVDERQETSIRAAAAAVLGLQAQPADAPLLARVLAGAATPPDVKHALLGALGELLPELGPEAEGVAPLAQALAAQTSASDVDLRRRALSLLAEARLEPIVRELDPTFLGERLETETNREALLVLLGLIGRFGRPEMLPPLLASPNFDGLCGNAVVLEAVVPAFGALARELDHGRIELAQRLASVPSETTRLTCLRHALALTSELSESQAFDLDPVQHAAICSWVWLALRAGVGPRELSSAGPAFSRRILEIHLPGGSTSEASTLAGGLGAFDSAHLMAVLRADLCLAGIGGTPYSRPAVEAAFQESFEKAPSAELRWLVLRDRARFRTAASEGVKALADYRRLLEAGPAADDLLSIPDLRSAHALLERLDMTTGEGRSATAGESFAILTRIVLRAEWQAEPSAVRLDDLQDWVQSGLQDGRPECLRRVEEALADLPQTQGVARPEPVPAPIWLGLTREAEWLRVLWDLRARVRARLDATARG